MASALTTVVLSSPSALAIAKGCRPLARSRRASSQIRRYRGRGLGSCNGTTHGTRPASRFTNSPSASTMPEGGRATLARGSQSGPPVVVGLTSALKRPTPLRPPREGRAGTRWRCPPTFRPCRAGRSAPHCPRAQPPAGQRPALRGLGERSHHRLGGAPPGGEGGHVLRAPLSLHGVRPFRPRRSGDVTAESGEDCPRPAKHPVDGSRQGTGFP